MRRNRKKTVTTVEVTWETGSRVIVTQQQAAAGPRTSSAEETADDRPLPRLLAAAARLLRGEANEK
jgi:hypothetical protein